MRLIPRHRHNHRGKRPRIAISQAEITADLQRIFDELLGPALDQANQARASQIIMSARASGHGQVFQAGRDMHVTEH